MNLASGSDDVSGHADPIRRIRVLIAVGVRLYREGLAELLCQSSSIQICGLAGDFAAAISQTQALAPDIILLDTALPDDVGCVRQLLEASSSSRILAFAIKESEPEVISFAEAGVAGYVTRDATVEELAATIQSVACGQLLCRPTIAATLLRHVTRLGKRTSSDVERLTPRQLQIAELLSQGLSNKEIACRLRIEVSTVKNHVHQVLEKMGAARRGQAGARLRRATAAGTSYPMSGYSQIGSRS